MIIKKTEFKTDDSTTVSIRITQRDWNGATVYSAGVWVKIPSGFKICPERESGRLTLEEALLDAERYEREIRGGGLK